MIYIQNYFEKKLDFWFLIKKNTQKYFIRELLETDYVIAPSQFVKESYSISGFDSKRILLCPYGVDNKKFNTPLNINFKKDNQNKLNFVFIGGTKQLKGISYLISSFVDLIDKPNHLTIVGVNKLKRRIY